MATSMVLPRSPATARATLLLHLGFILTGMVNTMLGPLLPLLTTRWSLSDAQAGYLFAAQFGASILGVMISSWMVPRWGSRVTLATGLLVMGIGTGGLALGSWPLGMLGAFGSGLGFGLAIPTTNLLVSALNPGRRAAALNLVNFSWGIGAVSGPFLIAAFQRLHHPALFMNGVLAVSIMLAAVVATSPIEAQALPRSSESDPLAWRSRFVPVLAAIFFLYVGSEASVGGWIAAYARRSVSGAGMTWA